MAHRVQRDGEVMSEMVYFSIFSPQLGSREKVSICFLIFSEKFGNNVDIHSGGIDLAFPHHENEEAQSCQHHGVSQWVNYWLHTGHLHANRMKMSKSVGNSVTVAKLLDKYSADQFRLFCLMSHYRSGNFHSLFAIFRAPGISGTAE